MRITILNFSADIKFDNGVAVIEFKMFNEKLFEKLSDFFGLDYIKFKHFLCDNEKKVITENIDKRINVSIFKNIFKNYKSDSSKSVNYANNVITVNTTNKVFVFSNKINKRKLFLYVS